MQLIFQKKKKKLKTKENNEIKTNTNTISYKTRIKTHYKFLKKKNLKKKL